MMSELGGLLLFFGDTAGNASVEVVDASEGHERNPSDDEVDGQSTRELVISQERIRDCNIQQISIKNNHEIKPKHLHQSPFLLAQCSTQLAYHTPNAALIAVAPTLAAVLP